MAMEAELSRLDAKIVRLISVVESIRIAVEVEQSYMSAKADELENEQSRLEAETARLLSAIDSLLIFLDRGQKRTSAKADEVSLEQSRLQAETVRLSAVVDSLRGEISALKARPRVTAHRHCQRSAETPLLPAPAGFASLIIADFPFLCAGFYVIPFSSMAAAMAYFRSTITLPSVLATRHRQELEGEVYSVISKTSISFAVKICEPVKKVLLYRPVSFA
jgi:hypothetical protein